MRSLTGFTLATLVVAAIGPAAAQPTDRQGEQADDDRRQADAAELRRLAVAIDEHREAGDYTAAAAAGLKKLEIERRLHDSGDAALNKSLRQVAELLLLGARGDEALALLRELREIYRRENGAQHWRTIETEDLIALYTRAVELSADDLARLQESDRMMREAAAALDAGRPRDVLQLAQAAHGVHVRLLGDQSKPALYLVLLQGGALAQLGQLTEAIEHYERVRAGLLRIFPPDRCPGGQPDLATASQVIGMTALRAGDILLARERLLEAMSVFRRLYPPETHPQGHESLLECVNKLVEMETNLQALTRARWLLDYATDMSRALYPTEHYPHGSEQAAMTILLAGRLAAANGQLGIALQRAREALEMYRAVYTESAGSRGIEKRLDCMFLMANVFTALGEYRAAEDGWRAILKLQLKLYAPERYPHGHPELAAALNNLAQVLDRRRKFEEAEKLHLVASRMCKKLFEQDGTLNNGRSLASSLGALGYCYARQKKFDEAAHRYAQQLELLQRLVVEREVVGVEGMVLKPLINLSDARQRAGAPTENWLPPRERALDLARRLYPDATYPNGHPDLFITLQYVVAGFSLLERYDEAVPHLIELAEKHYAYVARELSSTVVGAVDLELLRLKHELDWLLTYAFRLRDQRPELAEEAYRRFGSQKSVVLDALIHMRRIERELASDPQLAALAHELEQQRALMNALVMVPEASQGAEPLHARQRALREELHRLENQFAVELAQRSGTLSRRSLTLEELLPHLRADGRAALVEYVRYEQIEMTPEVGGVAKGEPYYAAFVVAPGAEPTIELIDLGPAGEIERLIEEYREHIREVPRALSFSSRESLVETYRELATPLYRRVFEPVAQVLGDADSIYLAADDELNRIAFETLVDENGQFLIERYSYSYLSSSSDLLRERDPPGEGVVVFADPAFDADAATQRGVIAELAPQPDADSFAWRSAPDIATRGLSWSRLPGTAAEVELIEQIFSGTEYGEVTTYAGERALEGLLKQVERPRLLHLATHGFYLPEIDDDDERFGEPALSGMGTSAVISRLRREQNPLYRSGLVLAGANRANEDATESVDEIESGDSDSSAADDLPAWPADDGWVTAEEVAMLDLQGTELVVLSACETGLADVRTGENVSGLRRAFLHAGARNLVTSLYKVPDDATHRLMGKFYTQLREVGPREALRSAQLAMMEEERQEYGAAHPFFWGSFIFVGPD